MGKRLPRGGRPLPLSLDSRLKAGFMGESGSALARDTDRRTLVAIPDRTDVHPAWLPAEAFRAVGSRRVLVLGEGLLVDTVREEVTWACARHGGGVRHRPPGETAAEPFDLVLTLATAEAPAVVAAVRDEFRRASGQDVIGEEGFVLARRDGVTVVLADEPAGLLYGLFHVVRLGE